MVICLYTKDLIKKEQIYVVNDKGVNTFIELLSHSYNFKDERRQHSVTFKIRTIEEDLSVYSDYTKGYYDSNNLHKTILKYLGPYKIFKITSTDKSNMLANVSIESIDSFINLPMIQKFLRLGFVLVPSKIQLKNGTLVLKLPKENVGYSDRKVKERYESNAKIHSSTMSGTSHFLYPNYLVQITVYNNGKVTALKWDTNLPKRVYDKNQPITTPEEYDECLKNGWNSIKKWLDKTSYIFTEKDPNDRDIDRIDYETDNNINQMW